MTLRRVAIGLVCGLVLAGCSQSTARTSRGEKITVVKPHAQDIERGATERLTVVVDRDNYSGPVKVDLSNLPSGVNADTPQSTYDDKVELILRASENADLVSGHKVMLTAEGPEGVRASETFDLTVKSRS